jgi:hypothetical protein
MLEGVAPEPANPAQRTPRLERAESEGVATVAQSRLPVVAGLAMAAVGFPLGLLVCWLIWG